MILRALPLGLALLLASASSVAASEDVKDLTRRAEAGDAAAQIDLARRFDTGTGVSRNGAAAKKWYLAAAQQGNADAENSLGSILQADEHYAEALHWYELASAQGDTLATNNLAYLYDAGLGVQKDIAKAFALYTQAANAGEPRAMLNLGVSYGAGQAVTKDLLSACIWIGRAQRRAGGDQKLAERSNFLMSHQREFLSPEQLRECKDKIADWEPSASH